LALIRALPPYLAGLKTAVASLEDDDSNEGTNKVIDKAEKQQECFLGGGQHIRGKTSLLPE
jgi:hypothetical protein